MVNNNTQSELASERVFINKNKHDVLSLTNKSAG